MEAYDYIRHISLEDFKKLDINQIAYVQMNNGDEYIIDQPYMYNQDIEEKNNTEANIINSNQEKTKLLEDNSKIEKKHKKRKKRNRNKNKNSNKINEINNIDINQKNEIDNYDNKNLNYYENYNNYDDYQIMPTEEENNYSLPNIYDEYNQMKFRSNSVEIKNKGIKLFHEEWKDLQDYDVKERMQFYDAIPKRAKFWESESYDPTKSQFQSKRFEKTNTNNNQDMHNYMPIKQDSFSDMEDFESSDEYAYNGNNEESQKNENYYNLAYDNQNYGYPLNQETSVKELYELAFGPQFAQYIFNQQGYQPISNNPENYYSQDNNNINNTNDINDYYQNIQDDDNDNQYQYYQNNYNDYNNYYDPNSYYYEGEDYRNLEESELPKEANEIKEIKEIKEKKEIKEINNKKEVKKENKKEINENININKKEEDENKLNKEKEKPKINNIQEKKETKKLENNTKEEKKISKESNINNNINKKELMNNSDDDEDEDDFDLNNLTEEEKMALLQQREIIMKLQEEAEARGEHFDIQEYFAQLAEQSEEEDDFGHQQGNKSDNKLNKSF
jgi:hypothetical protein